MEVDIRILPARIALCSCRAAQGHRREIEIEFTEYQEPTFSTSRAECYRLMEAITRGWRAGRCSACPISTGSTDSKYLRSAGIPAYGIGHMDAAFDQSARTTVHGRNERTDLASLQLKTRFLMELAKRYLA